METETPKDTRPPVGWSEPDHRGHVTYTMHGSSILVDPPEREGFEAYFIARNGSSHTRWTYRPVTTDTETGATW